MHWPEDANPLAIKLAKDALAIVGEPRDPDGNPYHDWEDRFVKVYEILAEGETRRIVDGDLSRALLPAHAVTRLTDGRTSPA